MVYISRSFAKIMIAELVVRTAASPVAPPNVTFVSIRAAVKYKKFMGPKDWLIGDVLRSGRIRYDLLSTPRP